MHDGNIQKILPEDVPNVQSDDWICPFAVPDGLYFRCCDRGGTTNCGMFREGKRGAKLRRKVARIIVGNNFKSTFTV
jgi:hypothetical protein